MSQQIIQINFNFTISADDFEKVSATIASKYFTNIPGLLWKIWLINAERKEAGGIYLFENDATAKKYLASDIIKSIEANPVFENIVAKQFDFPTEANRITSAPVAEGFASTLSFVSEGEIDC